MKLIFRVSLMALTFGVIFLGTQKAHGQDVLAVPWETSPGSGIPQVNALYNAVVGDTDSYGARKNLNRVYQLAKGGIYWNTEHFENHGYALRFVGETPDPTNPLGNPATLQMVARNDGSVDGHILLGYGDVYFKNLYIIGSDDKGVQTYYQPMEFEANNLHVVFDSCVFERSNFAIPAWTSKGCDVYFTNCKFRNLVEKPMTQEWTGRGISMWADQDTVVVENCTFFNVGMCALQIEGGAANYVRFNHNTLVDIGHGINSGLSGPWWREAYFTNCLFINQYWHGEGYLEYSPILNPSRDPRALLSGMFVVGTLPASYGPDAGRRIVFSNNAAYRDSYFTTQYGDTVRAQPFTNVVTDSFFATYSPANNGQMVLKDTTWLTAYPQFPKAVIDSLGALAAVQWTSIVGVRTATANPPSYFYNLQDDPTYPTWPLTENFAYTDASLLTGKTTDNLPLGDLNWFPTQKATWEANKASEIAAIENIPGKKVKMVVDSAIEAESGTLSGTAAKAATQGLTYYDYKGAGSITWTFNITKAGEYDTRWLVNETARGMSGPVLAINGTQIHDKAHMWGQFVFDNALGVSAGMSNTDWIWVPITANDVGGTGTWSPGDSAAFTLPAGPNTIAVLGGGWGEMLFSEVDIVLHGTTDTIKLKAPDAVTSLVTAGAVGVKWVASGFNFVKMGANGGITWDNVNVPATGNYTVRVFYQNIHANGAQTGEFLVDGSAVVSSLPFAATPSGSADSSGLDVFWTKTFPLSAGTHTLKLTGANGVNVDYIQLIQQVTGVRQRPGIPESFTLEQNYPNPFNPTTQINYSVPQKGLVTLTVYNVLGQKVETLFSGVQNAGNYTATFNAGRYASGVYFYRLEAGSLSLTKKMMLIK